MYYNLFLLTICSVSTYANNNTYTLTKVTGTTAILYCPVEEKVSDISWSIESKQIYDGITFSAEFDKAKKYSISRQFDENQLRLIITDLTKEDENEYCCNYIQNNTAHEHCTNLLIAAVVSTKRIGVQQSTFQGDTAILECPVERNITKVQWIRNALIPIHNINGWNKNVINIQKYSLDVSESNQRFNLIISNVSKAEEDLFCCDQHIINGLANQYCTNLHITGISIVDVDNNLKTGKAGENITLTCQLTNPVDNVTISWVYDSQTVASDETLILNYTVKLTEQLNETCVTCMARTKTSRVVLKKHVRIKINNIPSVDVKVHPRHCALENDTVTLLCKHRTSPGPHTIIWIHNGTEIPDETDTTITISKTSSNESLDAYQCIVNDSTGSSDGIISIVASMPHKPTILAVHPHLSGFRIKWSPGENRDCNQSFKVLYSKTKFTEWQSFGLISSQNNVIDILHLAEDTWYQVYMYAENSRGKSPKTNTELVRTGKAENILSRGIFVYIMAVVGAVLITVTVAAVYAKYKNKQSSKQRRTNNQPIPQRLARRRHAR